MSTKPDLLYAALKAQVGRDGTIPDLWRAYLLSLGYSGAFPDMAAKHAADLGVSVQAYYETDGSLFAGGASPGPLTELIPTSFSQSSVYVGDEFADTSNMRDANGNGDTVTAGITDSELGPWIQADLGSNLEVARIDIGTGTASGFGAISVYLTNTGASFIQYSTDGVSWTNIVRLEGLTTTDSGTAERDIQLWIAPTQARYWRIHRTDTNFLATATFKFYGHTNPLLRQTGIVYAQSSVYEAPVTASEANLNELPHVSTTGAATNNDAPGWIRADLGSSKEIALVVLGGGILPGTFGGASSYLPSLAIQTSDDAASWTTRYTTPSSASYYSNTSCTEYGFPVEATARYVRISKSGYVATTAFRVYTRN